MSLPVLDIEHLRTYFHTEEGVVKAVDDISFRIEQGRTLGIVGESGSGKSVTSLSIMRLLASAARIESGRIAFLGKDLVGLPERQMQSIRGSDISMIFQEPMTSLNPVFTVGAQVIEAIMLHQHTTKAEARERAIELFDEVGIPDPQQRVDSYPHQMSGGQKQRVMIAMALSCNPKLLIADEPTTALDVTIQAQILDILRQLRDERGMSIMFITHDLGVIAEIADDVLVMFQRPGGRVRRGARYLRPAEASLHQRPAGLPAAAGVEVSTTADRDDFMETQTGDGREIRVVEKRIDDARLKELAEQGRGRLLHPKSELAAMGHPWERRPPRSRRAGCRRRHQAAAAGREPRGLFPRATGHFGTRCRPRQSGRRHQLSTSIAARRWAWSANRVAARRPPAGPSCD